MVKVYLPSFALCTISLTINLLILGIYPFRAIAQDSVPETNSDLANNNASAIEPEILSEINRVRTNPMDYARWLEEQKQYYDGSWIRLPGEKDIRTTSRGLKALNEAIAFLKEQKPLPPLSTSEQAAAVATDKLEDFTSQNSSIQNISYGRTTPQGIVMSLVVDEIFPDRRRRKSLLSSDTNNTGVVCQSDPRYAKVCAISYSNEAVDVATEKPDSSATETEATTSKPEQPQPAETPATKPPTETEATASKPEQPQPAETSNASTPKPEAETNNEENVAETLPQPPQPQAPPTPTVVPESEKPITEDEETEVAQTNLENEVEENDEELEEVEKEIEEIEKEIEAEAEESPEEEKADEEVFEAEESPEDAEEKIATNSDASQLLENVERGALEEGDRVIPEDGSFYDSYPLEGKSGESFTISLESSQFDAFVALIDAKGNIVEQNDDISEEDSNSRIRVTIPEDGVYNVIVNAYDEGGAGEYVLTVNR